MNSKEIPDPRPRLTFGLDLVCHYCGGTGIRREGMTRAQRNERGRILRIYHKLGQLPPKLDRTCGVCEGTGLEKWNTKRD